MVCLPALGISCLDEKITIKEDVSNEGFYQLVWRAQPKTGRSDTDMVASSTSDGRTLLHTE
ncbi:hypothetical protein EMIT0194MI4_10916 [Pseudomonas sp. IT-194MI4]